MTTPTGWTPGPGAGRPVQDGAVPADPFALLRSWAPGNDDPARPLTVVATVDADGVPDARTVLLTAVSDDAVGFHTDSRSRKVDELRRHPFAAMVIRWEADGRQVVLRGPVAETTADEQSASYARRSRYLQVLAWVNDEKTAELPRAEREAHWRAFDEAHPTLDAPDTWVGFALRPSEIVFWEGSPDGPSRRARYRAGDGGGWALDYLPG